MGVVPKYIQAYPLNGMKNTEGQPKKEKVDNGQRVGQKFHPNKNKKPSARDGWFTLLIPHP